jgi:hypothetical protein
MATCSRMVWSTANVSWGQNKVVNGRTYVTGPGTFDCLNGDVAGLQAAGAILIAQSGAVAFSPQGTPPATPQVLFNEAPLSPGVMIPYVTGTDPGRPVAASAGTLYVDVGIQRVIVWDGSYWRDIWTGQIV